MFEHLNEKPAVVFALSLVVVWSAARAGAWLNGKRILFYNTRQESRLQQIALDTGKLGAKSYGPPCAFPRAWREPL